MPQHKHIRALRVLESVNKYRKSSKYMNDCPSVIPENGIGIGSTITA
jgi:predicted nucleic acid-binding Zn finger protein